jgi:hypothetical protein
MERFFSALIKDKDGQTLDAEYMKQLELDV